MAKIPLDQMADRGYDNMPEWTGYILSELKLAVKALLVLIEKKADKEDLLLVASHVSSSPSTQEIVAALNVLSDRIEALEQP